MHRSTSARCSRNKHSGPHASEKARRRAAKGEGGGRVRRRGEMPMEPFLQRSLLNQRACPPCKNRSPKFCVQRERGIVSWLSPRMGHTVLASRGRCCSRVEGGSVAAALGRSATSSFLGTSPFYLPKTITSTHRSGIGCH